MNSEYFSKDTHKYMQYEDEFFSNFIFGLIREESFSRYATAIELGAGYGRFSPGIIKAFAKSILVEPVESYSRMLKKRFAKPGVEIAAEPAEEFLRKYNQKVPVVLFCFHLMHHLKKEQRKSIYSFVRRTGSKGVFVEPNPFNPLILLQVMLHPDMSIIREVRYLSLTSAKYRRELEESGLRLTHFKRICFFPPLAANFLLHRGFRSAAQWCERLNSVLPFFGSYQMIACEEGK